MSSEVTDALRFQLSSASEYRERKRLEDMNSFSSRKTDLGRGNGGGRRGEEQFSDIPYHDTINNGVGDLVPRLYRRDEGWSKLQGEKGSGEQRCVCSCLSN